MKHIILFIIPLLVLASCSSTKKLEKQLNTISVSTFSIFDSIAKYEHNVQSFSSNFSVKIDADKSIPLKGSLRIKRDSIIWITISPGLNIEAMRVKLTPDSVFMVNRLDKTYYSGDYSIVYNMFGIVLNFKSIQSLLLNEPVFYPFNIAADSVAPTHMYDFKKKDNVYTLERNKDTLHVNQKFLVTDSTFKIAHIEIKDKDKNLKFESAYSNFQILANALFPNNSAISIKLNSKEISIQLEYIKPECNNQYQYPFSINSKYNKL